MPLVGLPGRAGLDLSLSLSYNSLVWTKTGNYISFDDDHGFPGPGFRLGFPVIQPLYFNSEVGKYAFLLIGTDGSRTELRRVGTSALYEAADSSYLLLDASTMVLRTTDGTQLKYELKGSEYQCTEIKDRNGNYITINYTAFARIDTVIDTLERSVKFNYDANGWLTSITQIWNQGTPSQVTHHWATFAYTNTTIQTNFTDLTVSGPSNGSAIKTLSKVTLADGSHYDFSYTSWGQVWKVSNFAADNHLLNYRSYDLPPTADPQSPYDDCPRFTQRRDWAENWNQNISGVEQEAITSYVAPATETSPLLGGGSLTGLRAQITTTDLTSTKIFFIDPAGTTSDWQRGLPALVNTYDSTGTLQRQVRTTWTQDNTSVSYPVNPRVLETNTYDPAGNRARVQITYQQLTFANGTSCHLPRDVYEYAANATTILRSTRTDYHTGTVYTDRRIIGLPSETRLYEGNVNSGGVLKSKVGYFYDNENGSSSIQGTDAPIQHDNTNYTASFVTGRANLSSVRRYDVTNTSQFTTTRRKFNTAGALVSTTDASNHTTQVSYAESFSDGNNSRNTLAYPTTLTDPDNYTATAKYNFDFGAMTYRRTPQPNSTQNQPGPEQSSTYDTIGRLQQVTNQVNGAYTRYVYPNTMTRVDTFTTIQDNLGEAHSFSITDGAGRVIGTATAHPGSIGGYSGQKFVYDVMGRTIKTSNPTETNASGAPSQWVPAGDDATAGWIHTQQTYDWKGRSLVTTNQDGTTKTASYTGCGCAGGEVVMLTDEGTLDGGVVKKRQQKIYSDVLGRTVKTEVLNWDGPGPNGTGGTVYSTTVNAYNVLDQVTLVREYAGTEASGAYQDTTISYDGYGRLKTKHVPEQDPGTNTVWTYNPDDTINTTTDARGAVTTFGYTGTNRKLVTSVTQTLTGQPNVTASFSYDAVGNRTSMTDSLGTTSYSYDSLSRLTSETRGFTGVGNYTIGYQYNLANDLISITGPANTTINYTRDSIGRMTSITRPGQTLASAISYRASGAMKHMLYGDNSTLDATFNSRLLPATYTVSGKISKTYSYHNDGALRFSSDFIDHRFDRSYGFDHAGRLKSALSGAEARGEGTTTDRPYHQTYGYDAFNHLNQRTVKTWSTMDFNVSWSYANNRRLGINWHHDADGRLTDGDDHYDYDAAGRNTFLETSAPALSTAEMTYDGDGKQIKTIETWLDENLERLSETKYYVRSTVLGGQVLTEVESNGGIWRSFVYAGPAVLGWIWQAGGSNTMNWEQRDPSGATVRGIGEQELDPLGADAGTFATSITPTEHALISFGSSYNPANPEVTYTIDGIRMPVEDFVHHAGFILKDPLGLLDWFARKSAIPIGSLAVGVKFGHRAEMIYDANGKVFYEKWWYDSELSQVSYGAEYAIYGNATFDLTLLPQDPIPVPGPDPRKKPRGGMDDEQWRNFMLGYNVALSRLDDSQCLKAVSDLAGVLDRDGPKGPKAVLQGIFMTNNFVYVPDLGGRAIAQATVGTGINTQVKLSDKFFMGELGASNTNMDDLLYRNTLALVILHELAHALGGDHKGVDDGRDEAKKWNDRLFADCFPK